MANPFSVFFSCHFDDICKFQKLASGGAFGKVFIANHARNMKTIFKTKNIGVAG
jgi:hypothetical protein